MPLYEYNCRPCKKRFELLLFGDEKPACPKCHGRNLERLVSRFAALGAGKSSDDFGSDFGGDFGGGDSGDDSGDDDGDAGSAGACGTCGDPRGPGSCAGD
jgi:putative FmdB family regulatory protein